MVFKKNHFRHFTICVLYILFSGVQISHAQIIDEITKREMLQLQMNRLESLNDSLFNWTEVLLNGKVHYNKGDLINHPYFIENSWLPGKILLSGRSYISEMLKYDLSTDKLINVFITDSVAIPLEINREVIREFIIEGHHFKFIENPAVKGKNSLSSGFYEVLYESGTSLLVRYSKTLTRNRFTLADEYLPEVTLYIRKGESFIPVKNQKSLINSLGDHEGEIKSYMKANDIRFSMKNFKPVIKLIEYYNSL